MTRTNKDKHEASPTTRVPTCTVEGKTYRTPPDGKLTLEFKDGALTYVETVEIETPEQTRELIPHGERRLVFHDGKLRYVERRMREKVE